MGQLMVLKFFILLSFGEPDERDEVPSDLMHDFRYPPYMRSWRRGQAASEGGGEAKGAESSSGRPYRRTGEPGPSSG